MTSAQGGGRGVPPKQTSTDKLRECDSYRGGGGLKIRKFSGRHLSIAPYTTDVRTLGSVNVRLLSPFLSFFIDYESSPSVRKMQLRLRYCGGKVWLRRPPLSRFRLGCSLLAMPPKLQPGRSRLFCTETHPLRISCPLLPMTGTIL